MNFFFHAEDGIRDADVTGVQTCALPISLGGLISGNYTSFIVSDFDCPTCNTPNNSSIDLVDPTPPTIDAGPDQVVCEGESVVLTAANPDGASITWDNAVNDGLAFVSPDRKSVV